MEQKLEQLKGHLIVSCQALPPASAFFFYYGKNGQGSGRGRSTGIRANTKEDIAEIKRCESPGNWNCETGLPRQ